MKITKLKSSLISIGFGIIFVILWIPFAEHTLDHYINSFFAWYILPLILFPIIVGTFLYKIDKESQKKEKIINIIIGIITGIIISSVVFFIILMIALSNIRYGV